MLQISIIVFREILEIALVISILVVATRGVKGRKRWICAGIGLGVLGSVILAFFTDNISSSLEGVGQEIFNASILLASAVMISWTVIWMTKYGKKIAFNLKLLGRSVAVGEKELISLMPVVALCVLREGAEIVLFSYGSFVSGANIANLMVGALSGLLSGIVVGFALYYGLLKILGKHFFTVTTYLLVLLAAGMTSQAIGFLSMGGIVPEIIYPVWDSSFLISEQGIIGKVLHALIGYIARPSAAQLIGYFSVVTLLVLGLHYDWIKEKLGKKTFFKKLTS